MTADLGTLSFAAVALGFTHCLFGPDHYVPFVAMSRAGLWSLRKTLIVTLLCGIGHVASSALLGFLGIVLGLFVFQLERVEAVRGDFAGWLLTLFGIAYLGWGLAMARRASRGAVLAKEFAAEQSESPPLHIGHHAHGQPAHAHRHPHPLSHLPIHSVATRRSSVWSPWILFLIFIFGPCEPLIPLLMYPAAKANVWSVLCVTGLFAIATLITMTVLVTLIYKGTCWIRLERAEPFGHAIAGLIVLGCGAAILCGL